jgi:hypothetical protein
MQQKVGCYDAQSGSVLFLLQTLCLIETKVKAGMDFTASIGSKLRDAVGLICSAPRAGEK